VVKGGTPPARVKALSDAMAKVAADPEFKEFLENQYAAKDSYIPAAKAEAYFKTQLADMKAAQASAAQR
jgi:tripartite-type tricarboxylate transporter receptor subunit TctC